MKLVGKEGMMAVVREKESVLKANSRVQGILGILVCTVLMLVFMRGFALAAVFAADLIGIHPMYDEVISEVFGNIGLALTAFLACKIVYRQTGERLSDHLERKPFHFTLVIVLTITAWSLGEVCDHIMGLILSGFVRIEPDAMEMSGWVYFISIVICAPVIEEIIFRFGYMELLRKNSGAVFTLLFSTILFAAAHTYNLQNTAEIFVCTLLCAYVYYRTGNLLYTILEHALHNLMCYIPLGQMLFLGEPVYYESNGFILAGTPWFVMNLTLLLAGVACLILLFQKQYAVDGSL